MPHVVCIDVYRQYVVRALIRDTCVHATSLWRAWEKRDNATTLFDFGAGGNYNADVATIGYETK